MKTDYPEHEKLAKVQEQSQIIGEFLEWQRSRGIKFGRYNGDGWLDPDWTPIRDLLAEFFEIDQEKLEDEKLQMLEEFRKHNAAT